MHIGSFGWEWLEMGDIVSALCLRDSSPLSRLITEVKLGYIIRI